MRFVDKVWYRHRHFPERLVSLVLTPLSWLFGVIVTLRRWGYASGILFSSAPAVPVIVVGGITAGGSGKTPLCIALLRFLAENGYKPGLISRGYRGKCRYYPQEVTAATPVAEAGDEAVLVKRAVGATAMVMVDPMRDRGAYELVHRGVNVIVSDDGLQHYSMQRDVEIAVLDGRRMWGNRRLLPAGPLRESVWRLGEVDFIVANGTPYLHGTPFIYYDMNIRPNTPQALNDSKGYAPAPGTKVCALAGIGHPERFSATLQAMGYQVDEVLSVADHAVLPDGVILSKARRLPVMMTEKDAVKYPHMSGDNVFVVRVRADVDPIFFEGVLNKINARAEEIARRRNRQVDRGSRLALK